MIGCLRTRVRKQPIIALYFVSENELKLYNLEAWYQNVTDFIPIFLTCERNTHVVKFHMAIIRISHIDKTPPKLLHFAFGFTRITIAARCRQLIESIHMHADWVPIPHTCMKYWY